MRAVLFIFAGCALLIWGRLDAVAMCVGALLIICEWLAGVVGEDRDS